MQRLSVRTDERSDVLDVTERVASAVPDDHDGHVVAHVEHTTAALIVNEAERRLLGDFEDALAGLVPDEGWAHDAIDDNADAHVRAALFGPTVTLPVVDGDLDLGTWQSVILVECDGPRERSIRVAPA